MKIKTNQTLLYVDSAARQQEAASPEPCGPRQLYLHLGGPTGHPTVWHPGRQRQGYGRGHQEQHLQAAALPSLTQPQQAQGALHR